MLGSTLQPVVPPPIAPPHLGRGTKQQIPELQSKDEDGSRKLSNQRCSVRPEDQRWSANCSQSGAGGVQK